MLYDRSIEYDELYDDNMMIEYEYVEYDDGSAEVGGSDANPPGVDYSSWSVGFND